ncbi:hypothetical protein [Nonomuraea sp. NEAU-A123]|uniref:hypothetical protein n=1 Tax=Nonomuraea sp. NEAU-A123 TaxID=2839649 RepID=UPI001BE3E836|nr:hypothetical protein [Nonomuraea sp. NEAU-A123]MBT2224315.1 hypothetical protein [Nonomuraea sp. NEAU-A123]
MKAIDEINELLRPLARIGTDEPVGLAGGARAQALFTDIIAQERQPTTAGPPRRLRDRYRARPTLLGLAASVVLALGAVLGPSLLGYGDGTSISYANSAVEIREEADTYVARIKDPYADQRRFSEAFRALGLNVEIKVIPVSPASVGKIVMMQGAGPFHIRREPADCDLADSGCFMAVTVPVALKGAIRFDLGRPAKPGESYENEWQSATRAGEQLAGAKVSGRSVDDVLAEVRKRGLTAEFSLVSVGEGSYELKPLAADQVGANWIVYKVASVRVGVVRLQVTPERNPALEYESD